MILIHPEQMHNLLAGAAIIAAKTTAMMLGHGHDKDIMLQKTAYAKYGNKTVKKWHKSGLLHPKRVEGCIYFPVIELLIASQTEIVNRLTPMAQGELRDYLLEEVKNN